MTVWADEDSGAVVVGVWPVGGGVGSECVDDGGFDCDYLIVVGVCGSDLAEEISADSDLSVTYSALCWTADLYWSEGVCVDA